jgi:myo-inositol-1(or 4)-monophosphatase
MHPVLNIAVRAARNAGSVIVRYVNHVDGLDVTTKGYNDFVSEVDRLAEAEIINVVRKAYPDHSILAEEGGKQGKSEFQWIIDPLDGTTNFLHGFPQFAVSIALQHKNKIEQAVIYDPLRQELYTATLGSGAFMNERRLRISKARELKGTLIGTGFPFKHPQHLDAYLGMFKTIHLQAAGIRRAGAASLDLAYVAAGRLDGFWEIGLNPWDIAAGALLIQEAGGLISDFSGGHDYLETGNVIAGNPKVFKAILQNIQPLLTSDLKK